MATDPVCKMNVAPGKAAAMTEHAGQMYYLCSVTYHKAFFDDPKRTRLEGIHTRGPAAAATAGEVVGI